MSDWIGTPLEGVLWVHGSGGSGYRTSLISISTRTTLFFATEPRKVLLSSLLHRSFVERNKLFNTLVVHFGLQMNVPIFSRNHPQTLPKTLLTSRQ